MSERMDRADKDRAGIAIPLSEASWSRVTQALNGRGSLGDRSLAELIERCVIDKPTPGREGPLKELGLFTLSALALGLLAVTIGAVTIHPGLGMIVCGSVLVVVALA